MIRASIAVVVLLVACSLTRADAPTTRPVEDVAKPTLISLSVENASVKSVLDAMQKQSKFNPSLVSAQPDLLESKHISITLDKVPWIEALMRVCEAAELNPYNYGDRWTISPRGNQRMLGPRHVTGPAMVALTTVVTETNITYDAPNRTSRQLTVTGVLTVEPTLEVDGVSSVTDLRITDDLGRSLAADMRGSASGSSIATLRRDFTLTAALPDNQATQIQSITGTFIAPALIGRKNFEIPNLLAAEGKRFPVADGHATVAAVRKRSPQVIEVDIAFEKGTLPEGSSARLRSNLSRVQPRQTAKSEPATMRVHRIADRDGSTVLTLYIQFLRAPNDDADPDADRVVDLQWDLPTRYVDVAIPFTIKDIPLP